MKDVFEFLVSRKIRLSNKKKQDEDVKQCKKMERKW